MKLLSDVDSTVCDSENVVQIELPLQVRDSAATPSDYDTEFEQSIADDKTDSVLDPSDVRQQNASNDNRLTLPINEVTTRCIRPTVRQNINLRRPYNAQKQKPPKPPGQHKSPLERWECTQMALADAQSQNTMLRKKLKECQLELKTVQRQYKLQSVRLNRVIGEEAEFPQIIERLTAELHSLQIRLRDKTASHEASQRKVQELQHRVTMLERESAERNEAGDLSIRRRSLNATDQLVQHLEKEKQKVDTLQKQLEVANKNHKHRITMANEQIRKLRKSCRDLEDALAERTKMLQEKIKLLGLQNIYSQRIPKKIPIEIHTPESYISWEDMNPKFPTQHHGTQTGQNTSTLFQQLSSTTESMTEPSEGVINSPCDPVTANTVADVSAQQVKRMSETALVVAEGLMVESLLDTDAKSRSESTSTKEVVEMDYDLIKHSEQSGMSVNTKGTSYDVPCVNLDEIYSEDSADLYNLPVMPTGEYHSGAESSVAMHNDGLGIEQCAAKEPSALEGDKSDMTLCEQTLVVKADGHSESTENGQDPAEEEERKRRLLKTLNVLNESSCSSADPSPADMSTFVHQKVGMRLNDKGSSAINKIPTAETDFSSLEKTRENELWDELFGSKPKVQASSPAKTTKSKASDPKVPNVKFGDYTPSPPKPINSSKINNAKRPGTHVPNQTTQIPRLPRLNHPNASRPKDAIHPKYSGHKNFFREDDGQESDLEEELNV